MSPWQQELITQISGHLYKQIGPFYSSHDVPTLHVLSREGDEVTFLFEHYVYNYAQSGSDWADHYFVRGTAEVAGERLVTSAFTLVRTIHLTESESNDYSPSTVAALMVAGKVDEVDEAIAHGRTWSDEPEPAY